MSLQVNIILWLAEQYPEYDSILLGIANTFQNKSYLIYNEGNKKFESLITFGLMSGIKTTSMFGSLINVAIIKYIMHTNNIRCSYILALGDDLDVQLDNIQDTKRVLKAYNEL